MGAVDHRSSHLDAVCYASNIEWLPMDQGDVDRKAGARLAARDSTPSIICPGPFGPHELDLEKLCRLIYSRDVWCARMAMGAATQPAPNSVLASPSVSLRRGSFDPQEANAPSVRRRVKAKRRA
jgi:hypothetical protein